MSNQENTVETFEALLLELSDLCSQNKQSLLGKTGMKQAKLVEMFKERASTQSQNTDSPKWVKITCVDDMPIDEGFVLLKHENGDILVGQYTFDTSPFTATTEFYQSQDYEWIADLDDIVAWCKIPEDNSDDSNN